MQRFCTNCGRPLTEGETCTCQQTQAEKNQVIVEDPSFSKDPGPVSAQPNQAPPPPAPNASTSYHEQYGAPPTGQMPPYGMPGQQPGQPYQYMGQIPGQPPQPSKAGIFFKNVGNFIGTFFQKPTDMVRAATNHKDIGIGFFFAGINALFVALFMGIFFAQLSSILSRMMGGMGSMMNYGSAGLSLPFFPFFLSGLIMSVLGYFLLSALVFGAGKIGKSEGSFKGTLAALGVSTFPSTLCVILSIVLTFLIPDWAMYLIVATLFVWAVNAYQASQICLGMDKNRLYFLFPLAFLVMFFVTAFVVGKVFGWAVMQASFSNLW